MNYPSSGDAHGRDYPSETHKLRITTLDAHRLNVKTSSHLLYSHSMHIFKCCCFRNGIHDGNVQIILYRSHPDKMHTNCPFPSSLQCADSLASRFH